LIDIVNDKIYGAPKPAQAVSGAASANLVANSAMITVSDFTESPETAEETSVAAKSDKGSEVTLVAGQIPASPTR